MDEPVRATPGVRWRNRLEPYPRSGTADNVDAVERLPTTGVINAADATLEATKDRGDARHSVPDSPAARDRETTSQRR